MPFTTTCGRSEKWHSGGFIPPDPVYSSLMFETNSDLFNSALESLPQFIEETDADWGMVYDFMEAQVGTLTDVQWDEVAKVYEPLMNDSRF